MEKTATVVAYTVGILAVGLAIWGSAQMDKAREKKVYHCIQYETTINNEIVCVEYE